MTYHIHVNELKNPEFLQILNSLRRLGVVESFRSTNDLDVEGEILDDDTLLSTSSKSQKKKLETVNP